MNHLSVFLAICIGSIFGFFILGGHYFLIYLNFLDLHAKFTDQEIKEFKI